MKRILFTACLISGFVAHSQVNIQWEARYTSAGANIDQAVDMEVDASGNTFVTGTSFNSGTGFDIVTVAYDNTGTEIWTVPNTYNGPNNSIDEAFALDYDPAGFVYVAGYEHVGAANYDIVVLKINALTGTTVWSRTYNQAGYYDLARDIKVDSNGDVYFVGSVQINSGGTNTDFITGKYSSNGTLLWTHTYTRDVASSGNLDEAKICHLNGDKLYVSGSSAGSGFANNLDFVTMEYDTAQTVPNYNWRTRYDYNGQLDLPVDIGTDPSGNIFVTGRGYFDANDDMDYVLVKYSSAGAELWDQSYNGTGTDKDNVNALAVDAAGNCIITGSSIGSISAEDIRTIKYDPNGVLLWNKNYTTNGAFIDEGTDVSVAASGDIYVSGFSQITGNSHDFTTIKYNGTTGVIEWTTHYDGLGNNSDKALAMFLDVNENIFITGTSTGSGTAQDYMTIKYCQLTTDAGLDTSICVNDAVQLNATGGLTFTWDVVSGDPIVVGTNFSCNPCSNPIASPTVTTTYSVASTNTAGCTDYDTVIVTVNPLPGPNITNVGDTIFCIGDSVILFSNSYPAYSWNTGGTQDSIHVHSSGTYTVTVTDTMGCLNSSSMIVIVNPLPNVDAGLPDSLCLGDSTQLMASNANNFTWTANSDLSATNVPDPWATPTTDTTYYVVGQDGNGCINSDSVTIHVYPVPTPPNITDITASMQLVSSYSTGNQWYMNGFAVPDSTNQIYHYDMNADYWILYTDGNGCTAWSDTISISSVDTTDTGDYIYEHLKIQMNLYPNPTSGVFNMDLTLEEGLNIQMVIIDVQGRVIWEAPIAQYVGTLTKKIDLGFAPSGIYRIMLISDDRAISKSFVLQK